MDNLEALQQQEQLEQDAREAASEARADRLQLSKEDLVTFATELAHIYMHHDIEQGRKGVVRDVVRYISTFRDGYNEAQPVLDISILDDELTNSITNFKGY